MIQKKENENKTLPEKKNQKVAQKKGESQENPEKERSDSTVQQNDSLFFLTGVSNDINFTMLEERRKTLAEEHEKLLENNRLLQEEVLRLKSKIDKCLPELEHKMEELKRKVKELVDESRHAEVDELFSGWMAGLKVHKIPKSADSDTKQEKVSEDVPLKLQIEELKKQIGSFKEKMRAYKEGAKSSTGPALANVKEEIVRVREGISKLRVKFSNNDKEDMAAENAELIEKLDEVKAVLERLQ